MGRSLGGAGPDPEAGPCRAEAPRRKRETAAPGGVGTCDFPEGSRERRCSRETGRAKQRPGSLAQSCGLSKALGLCRREHKACVLGGNASPQEFSPTSPEQAPGPNDNLSLAS